jgi:TRAP transporter TAXI family solute receptor
MKNSAFLLATLLLATLLLALASASAQTTIRIAADSSSGTYSKMLGEIIGVCSTDDFNIVPASGVTGGAPGNLDALVNNRADAAFLHSDVYTANAQADPTYNRFQTLVALYPEQIHILALRQSKTKKNLVFTVEFNSLSDLKGYKVGAAGGGVFTARILNGQGEAGYSVVPFDRGDEVISALTNGQIDAALFVGAAPLPNLEKLNKNQYKLLPIGDAISSRVQGVYRPASINYPGLTNGPVKTMAAIATLLTRKFSTPAKIEAQAKLRACFDKHLGELQDNGSRSWQDVTPGDHGVLPWLDLPKTTAPSGKALIKKSNP